MANKIQRSHIGVIIGRFQVPEITGGHKKLIEQVCEMHEKVVILLGCSPVPFTRTNPLDFPTRRLMVNSAVPNATVLPIRDQSSDSLWSQEVDALIRSVYPIGTVTIYGGRDSFIKHYSGSFDTAEFPPSDYKSATQIRQEIGNSVPATPTSREGVIYATQNQFPKAYICVDVIIRTPKNLGREPGYNMVVGKRPNEVNWRLPGGFVDPGETLEQAATREVLEEVGCAISTPKYVTSSHTNDWRFTKGNDKLTTVCFVADFVHGPMTGGDDLPECKWVDLKRHDFILPHHNYLIGQLLDQQGERIEFSTSSDHVAV